MNRWKILAALLGAAGLVATIGYAGFDDVGHVAQRIGFSGIALLAVLHLPLIALTGYAWAELGAALSNAPPWQYVQARYIRESSADVLPFSQLGGIVAGARVLAVNGIGAMPASASLLADLVVEQAAKLPYVLTGAILLAVGWRTASLSLIAYALLPALGLICAVLLWRERVLSLLERAARRLAHRLPGLRLKSAADFPLALDRLFTVNRRTLTAFAAHAAAWMLGAFETWVALHLMGVPVSATQAFIIDSLFCGLRTLGFAIPAALGVQEVGYVLVCALVGVPAAPAVALSLVRRVREFLLGTPGLALWHVLESRHALAGVARD